MKLVLLKDGHLFEEREGFTVKGNNKIGALQGYFVITERELHTVKDFAKRMWRQIVSSAGISEDFRAHIRFDLVPRFLGFPERTDYGYDLGNLKIKGAYEVNCHGPECVSCDSLYREKFPEIAQYTPSAGIELAKALSQEYKTDEIVMVRGNATAKKDWGDALLREMNQNGFYVKEMSAREVMKKKPSPIWRWGMIDDREEYTQYDKKFREWLLRMQENLDVLSTVPLDREHDAENKKWIAKEDDIIIDSRKNLEKALFSNKDDHVLKPLIGTSGHNIIFGENLDHRLFKRNLVRAYVEGNYGLFKKILLPKVDLEEESITLDFLPSFLAKGSELHYLYSVVRVEPWKTYRERMAINVLQGGGYGGTVALEKF